MRKLRLERICIGHIYPAIASGLTDDLSLSATSTVSNAAKRQDLVKVIVVMLCVIVAN